MKNYTDVLYFMLKQISFFALACREEGAFRLTCKAIHDCLPKLTMEEVLETHSISEVKRRARRTEQKFELTEWSKDTPFDAFRACARRSVGEPVYMAECDPLYIAVLYEDKDSIMTSLQIYTIIKYRAHIPGEVDRLLRRLDNHPQNMMYFGTVCVYAPYTIYKITTLDGLKEVKFLFLSYVENIVMKNHEFQLEDFKKLISLCGNAKSYCKHCLNNFYSDDRSSLINTLLNCF